MNFEDLIVHSETEIRIDRYLKRILPLLTQGAIEKYLRNKSILVNHIRVRSNQRVSHKDKIQILPNIVKAYKKQIGNQNTLLNNYGAVKLAHKLLSEYLLINNDYFLAVNKPHSVAVQGGSNIKLSINDALNYLNQYNGTDYKLVHRLDKETSGVLLVAKGPDNAAKLAKAFKEQLIRKIYNALLSSIPRETCGIIQSNLSKVRLGSADIVQINDEGKYAETFYKVIKTIHNCALVEFKPTTGRMHQLRVHSKQLGCPIVGDKKYDGPAYSRMMLHAESLTIPAEIFGREYKIETILPEEFQYTPIAGLVKL